MILRAHWTEWSDWIVLRTKCKRRERKLMCGKFVIGSLLNYENGPGHRWEGMTYIMYSGVRGEGGPVCRTEEEALASLKLEVLTI